ncbi:Glutathionyl-hydroquinone reductase YqjG [Hypsibius exemplaris]|uniref:Glutathionyl-hydroquinone reductase YqjG n=1 Tax=Hypsibius exemplaris TaxID=2072580 RepID=A0A9X6NFM7_HYPEX|nr:Glutathionyl-hydroquinone reductase YqjG [Hypsibius exemplaris]
MSLENKPVKTGPTTSENPELRRLITADGSSGFPAETGRYHLYVGLACPFSHRTLIGRKLKGLENVITVDIVDSVKPEIGWSFTPDKKGCTPDTVNGKANMADVYKLIDPNYAGKVSVPLLWDKQTGTSVNNESAEILRMFNSEFNAFCQTDAQRALDLYPSELRSKIDEIDKWVAADINAGVYKCGFAPNQAAYDNAVNALFNALDKAEGILSKSRYLVGNQITEVDIKLFCTLIRFDVVYATLFKCDRKRILEYDNLWPYLRDLYQTPGFGETVDWDHIRSGYYASKLRNPSGIIATGPKLDFKAPHGRDKAF